MVQKTKIGAYDDDGQVCDDQLRIDDRHDEHRNERYRRYTRRQPVQSVDQIDRIRDTDDPQYRDQDA